MLENPIREYLLTEQINAAIKAGEAIMTLYNNNYSHLVAGENKPLMEVNRAAQEAVKEALGATRIPILSEEGREMLYDERRNWELFWLVDPLDGTMEFINHTHEFTVNIALVQSGRPISGVIYAPYLRKLYFASQGCGAYVMEDVEPNAIGATTYEQVMGGAQQLPRCKEQRARQRIAISKKYKSDITMLYIDRIREHYSDLELVEQGSSYKFCMLAEGDVDTYLRASKTYEWDTAAGELILTEAGGRCYAIDPDAPKNFRDESDKLRYNKEDLHSPWFCCHSHNSKI